MVRIATTLSPSGTSDETDVCDPDDTVVWCDGDWDGTPDGLDSAPTDACLPNSDAVLTWDCDNDGTPNSSDPDDTDACNPDKSK